MKKIIYILIPVLLVSCQNFLDIRTEATMPTSGMDFSKSENIFMPVSAAYAAMRLGDEGIALNYMGVLEIVSDDTDKGSTETDGPAILELDKFNYGPSNTGINAVWEHFYNISSAANYAIEAMADFEKEMSSEADKLTVLQCRSEARLIRAYAYFNLVRIFGSVPVIDKSMSAAELAAAEPVPVAQIYKFIYDDLDSAIENLPDSYNGEPGRFTRYTAMALKSKAALYNKDWAEAAKQADAIIASKQFSLIPDFRSVFSMKNENGSESLMEIQSSTLGLSSGAAPICFYAFVQGPRNNTPSNMQGWGFKVPSQALIDFLDGRGDAARKAATILASGSTTPEGDVISDKCPNPYYNGKVYTPSAYNKWSYNGYGFDYNIRLIRYAEVLLNFAEAMAQGAAYTPVSGYTADMALNEVRARAGLPAASASLDVIYDERRAELALEENRFFDLVRWGKAAEVLGPLGFTAGKNEVFPIPTAQRDLNTHLPATPGYTY